MILLSILFAALMIFAAKTLFKLNWWLFKLSFKLLAAGAVMIAVFLMLTCCALII